MRNLPNVLSVLVSCLVATCGSGGDTSDVSAADEATVADAGGDVAIAQDPGVDPDPGVVPDPGVAVDAIPGEPSCVPVCTHRECGDDTCGGVCGTCVEPEVCVLGRCAGACWTASPKGDIPSGASLIGGRIAAVRRVENGTFVAAATARMNQGVVNTDYAQLLFLGADGEAVGDFVYPESGAGLDTAPVALVARPAGGWYLAARAIEYGFSGRDYSAWVARVDGAGAVLGSTLIAGAAPRSLAVAPDGTAVLGGASNVQYGWAGQEFQAADADVRSVPETGGGWTFRASLDGVDQVHALAALPGGGYLAAGESAGKAVVWVVGLTGGNGGMTMLQESEGHVPVAAVAVIPGASGGFTVVADTTRGTGVYQGCAVLKDFDDSGNPGAARLACAQSVYPVFATAARLEDGSLVIAGTTGDWDGMGETWDNAWAGRFNDDGTLVWQYIHSDGYASGVLAAEAVPGGVVLAGWRQGQAHGNESALIVRLDLAGTCPGVTEAWDE